MTFVRDVGDIRNTWNSHDTFMTKVGQLWRNKLIRYPLFTTFLLGTLYSSCGTSKNVEVVSNSTVNRSLEDMVVKKAKEGIKELDTENREFHIKDNELYSIDFNEEGKVIGTYRVDIKPELTNVYSGTSNK